SSLRQLSIVKVVWAAAGPAKASTMALAEAKAKLRMVGFFMMGSYPLLDRSGGGSIRPLLAQAAGSECRPQFAAGSGEMTGGLIAAEAGGNENGELHLVRRLVKRGGGLIRPDRGCIRDDPLSAPAELGILDLHIHHQAIMHMAEADADQRRQHIKRA